MADDWLLIEDLRVKGKGKRKGANSYAENVNGRDDNFIETVK